mgnify:CR=1 FL=1
MGGFGLRGASKMLMPINTRYEIAATGQYMAFLRSLKGLILQREVNKNKTQ